MVDLTMTVKDDELGENQMERRVLLARQVGNWLEFGDKQFEGKWRPAPRKRRKKRWETLLGRWACHINICVMSVSNG